MLTNLVILTGLAVVLIIIGAAFFSFRKEEQAQVALAESIATGMNQPPSLHPVIDTDVCLGSSACVDACPESVLGRVGGVTHLIQANECIGHGRCRNSCPVGAIALVFGTAERGVDIPLLRKGYESNVDGVMIVGELGGMGLIRNAMNQGRKAVETIPRALAREDVVEAREDIADAVIVGGGPAGIAAALECVHQGRSYVLLEQSTLGGSITHYPRRKLVHTEKIKLPIVGDFGKSEMLKEELIAEFERVLMTAGITMLEGRQVTEVTGGAGDFRVKAESQDGPEEFRGKTVILAIGRRGTPRRLGIPGEHQPHVVYRLLDPEQYRHRKVLCVGGGDSAVESAVSLSHIAGCEVHLSYRGKSFFRLRKKNREDFEARLAKGKLDVHFQTNLVEITADTVTLEHDDGGRETLEIDDVIINIGGLLPTPFLESIGVQVETKYGEVAKAPPHGRHAGPQGGP